jgi:hypothetical protein
MRHVLFLAVSGCFLLAPLAAVAADDTKPIPAVATASKQVVCQHVVHEGMMVSRPTCLSASAWATEKEQGRQQLRGFQRQHLLVHH